VTWKVVVTFTFAANSSWTNNASTPFTITFAGT
jgi:hypothetical protein